MPSGRLPAGTAGAHLWPRMAGDQAGQLQRLALADGVDPLRVAFLLDVARQARVHDPHSGGGCKTQREKPGERHRLHPRALLGPISTAAAWDPCKPPSWEDRGWSRVFSPRRTPLLAQHASIGHQKGLPRYFLIPSDPPNKTFAISFAFQLFLFPFPNELRVIVLFYYISF